MLGWAGRIYSDSILICFYAPSRYCVYVFAVRPISPAPSCVRALRISQQTHHEHLDRFVILSGVCCRPRDVGSDGDGHGLEEAALGSSVSV